MRTVGDYVRHWRRAAGLTHHQLARRAGVSYGYMCQPWDQVHAEAERLEHALSEELEERIAAKLGQPTHDPHGDPIPTREGVVPARDAIPLSQLAPGAAGTVTPIAQQEQPVLQYLQSLGLVPGTHVRVTAVAPYGEVLTVRIGDASHAVGGTIARRVQVCPDVDGPPERELAAAEARAGGEPASIYHPRDGDEAPLAPRREESDPVTTHSDPSCQGRAQGRLTTTVVPWPTALCTRMCPPCCSTIVFAPARPRPEPGKPRAVEAR
jgi:Fe2+ transport system protein FeoA